MSVMTASRLSPMAMPAGLSPAGKQFGDSPEPLDVVADVPGGVRLW
jgi:hypothetical protein